MPRNPKVSHSPSGSSSVPAVRRGRAPGRSAHCRARAGRSTRTASESAPYEMTGAFFSSLNRSPVRSTAQLLERVSPPIPASVVADARSGWLTARSSGNRGRSRSGRVVPGMRPGSGASRRSSPSMRSAGQGCHCGADFAHRWHRAPPSSGGTRAPSSPSSFRALRASIGKRACWSTSSDAGPATDRHDGPVCDVDVLSGCHGRFSCRPR